MITHVNSSKKDEVIDITSIVEEEVKKSSARKGICTVNALHTTVALTTADLDPGTDQDILDVCRKIIPNLKFRHPHDPSHAPDHILSAIIGTGLSIPYEEKSLLLGTWQRIVFIEFNGPQRRKISINVI